MTPSEKLGRMQQKAVIRFFCEEYDDFMDMMGKVTHRAYHNVWRGEMEFLRLNGSSISVEYDARSFDDLIEMMWSDFLNYEPSILR